MIFAAAPKKEVIHLLMVRQVIFDAPKVELQGCFTRQVDVLRLWS